MGGYYCDLFTVGKEVTGDRFFRLHLAMQLINTDVGTKYGDSIHVGVGHKDRGYKGDQYLERYYKKYNPDCFDIQAIRGYGLIEESKCSKGGATDKRVFLWRQVRAGEYQFCEAIEDKINRSTSWVVD